ncbi:MAG: hypothetical protein U0893_23560 [Chloroflexota bacterium]
MQRQSRRQGSGAGQPREDVGQAGRRMLPDFAGLALTVAGIRSSDLRLENAASAWLGTAGICG